MQKALRALPGRLTAAIVALAIRQAWFTLLLAAIATAAALHYTRANLAIDTDTANMLDPKLPHRQAHREFRAAFPDLPGDIVIFIEAARQTSADDLADALADRLRAHTDIARVVVRPGADEFFRTNGLLYLDRDRLWDLDERLNAAAPLLGTLAQDRSLRGLFDTLTRGATNADDPEQQRMLAQMYERVASATQRALQGRAEPLHWRDELMARDVAPSGLARAFILVEPVLDTTDFQPAAPAVRRLRALLDDYRQTIDDATIRLTGSAVMDSDELVTVAEDAKLTTLLSFGCVSVLLLLGVRTLSAAGAVLITLACGLVWTAAFATAAVGALNIISVSFAVLFIGMGVDFGIQYTMRYLEEIDRGTSRTPALLNAAHTAGGALALAAVGAAICFFAFVPTSYRGLAQLGVISGFSMGVAWFANITVLPALLRLCPQPAARGVRAARVFDFGLVRFRRAVLIVSCVLAVFCLMLLPRARFDLNPLNLKDGNTEGVAAFRALAMDPASSPYTIQVLAPSLADADALAAKLKALPEVASAITLSSFVPADQPEKLEVIEGLQLALAGALDAPPETRANIDAEARSLRALVDALAQTVERSPSSELSAPARRLREALLKVVAREAEFTTLLPQLRAILVGDLNRLLAQINQLLQASEVSLESLPDALHDEWVGRNQLARVQVNPKADLNDNAAMRQFVSAVQRVAPQATDAPVELVEGSHAVIDACIQASLWALALTIILHIVVLHGVVDALLVAAPLVLAGLLTVATSVLTNVPFNFANIIALPLLIGLNNAYGAYLVVRKHGSESIDGLLRSSTPRAILFSGLTAIASFGVLGFSKHPGMAGMGILISVSLSYAIVSALVVLPALMASLEQPKRG